MQERNIAVTLEKAKEWYNSDNATLKEVALQAFSEKELKVFDFTKVKTFEDAKEALGYSNVEWNFLKNTLDDLKSFSKSSAAMFKLNIIRRALNKGYDLHLTKNADGQNCTWYPCFRFAPKDSTYYDDELRSGEYKKLGKISSEGVTYDVLGGDADVGGHTGLGSFGSCFGIGYVYAFIGFLGCATEEIAKHFGEYFGMLIMEAMYGDMIHIEFINE